MARVIHGPYAEDNVNHLLDNLEPQILWDFFYQLSQIPRASKKEAAAAAWVAEQGRKLGCTVTQDAVGNVVISKPATPGKESCPGVVLQAHVDMVCEKNEGTVHDFDKDPIKIRKDGDMLRATGTTLGADNGIGVAAGLAVLASKDVAHGPLELLVTVDEETGLTGANALKPGVLKGKYLINLDSEEEGILTIGCAGGMDTIATRKVEWTPVPAGAKALRIKTGGLKSGHSGIDINAQRGNAIRILARVLYGLHKDLGIRLASIKGGNKRNAIAREAFAVVTVESAKEGALKELVFKLEQQTKQAMGKHDAGLTITVENADAPRNVMADQDARAVINTLFTMVHGVVAMSPDIPGLVQTSTNLGVVDTREDAVVFNMLHRSSIDTSKMTVVDRASAHCELGGFQVVHEGAYPGWKPEPGSDLVKLVTTRHQELFGQPMEIKAIHAGLECGIIGEKYPGMQMVSMGPSMWDVHTPDEHVSIPSVANFWKLLVGVLQRV